MSVSVLHARSADDSLAFTDRAAIEPVVRDAHTVSEALDVVTHQRVDCVLTEQELDSGTGLELLERLRGTDTDLPIVLRTAEPDGQIASEATRHDVTAYHVRSSEEPVEDRIASILTEAHRSGKASDDWITTVEDETVDVTGQQRVDGGAVTHETPFVRIAETINDAVVTIDTDSEIQFANDGLAELTGYDRDELVGESFTMVMPERFREAHHAGVERYLETGERNVNWEYIELAIEHRDGTEIPVAVSFSDFEREGERFFTGLIRDISGRKSQARSLRQLHEVASDRSLSSMEKIRRVIDDHRERLGVSFGFLSLIEEGEETLVVTTGDNELTEAGMSAPLDQTYCQYTIEQDEPLIIGNIDDDDVVPDDIYELWGMSCYLGETVTVEGEQYGTLCFADEAATDQEFDDADIAFLEVLADWVGYELTKQRQRDRLREERERVEHILERIEDAFFAVDDDWEFTYFNRRAEEVLGKPSEDVIGENVWEQFPEAVDSTFETQYRQAMETQEPVTFEEYYPPLEKWFQVSAYPSEDGLSVYFSDVTERYEYTRALSAMHEHTQELARVQSVEDVARVVLDATMEVLGYDLCAVRYHDDGQLVPLAVSDPTTETAGTRATHDVSGWGPGEAYRTGETVLVEQPSERAETADDGPDPATFESMAATMYIPIADFGVLSVGTADTAFDDTDRSLAEVLASHAALAFERVEREQELRINETVLETVQGMVYALDSDRQFEVVTDPLAEWVGSDRDTLLASDPARIFPEDEYSRFERVTQDLLSNEQASTTLETELQTADGRTRPVEIEISVPPENSSFEGTIGVVRDLTALRETRRQLEVERDRFSYLFNNLPDAISDARFEDAEPIVQSVNDAFEDIFGYDEQTLVGNSLNDYILPEDERDHGRRIDEITTEGTVWQGEIERLTVDGIRHFLFRGVPYQTPDGDDHGFGIYTDITERKRREQRLQVLNRVLRHNLRNELTVLLGHAEQLREQSTDEALVETAESLCERIHGLSAMSEQARMVQEILKNEGGPTEPMALREFVESVREEYVPDGSDATVEIAIDDAFECRGDNRLRLAIGELVENAVDHAGMAPHVRVGAEADGADLLIAVEDDGPGLPDLEWAVISGTTEITQLSHGSGLGLWTARWVTEAYGGSIERVETDLGGAGIRLRLPGLA
ncbi:PAS domain S-box protein [Halovenus marina]|uniref:PAS domain S-box protein n=1 Tax=Halovenus marina TaxID=3396621 RepID=UPI003F57F6B7